MKNHVPLSFLCGAACLVSLLLNGCAGNTANRHVDNLETAIIEMAQRNELEDLILTDFEASVRADVSYRFGNPAEQLKQISTSLSEGYAKLADDIEGGRYACIGKNELSQYQGSEWTYRTIGFPNWTKSIQGHLLLEKARSLKYQILLLKLADRKDTAPLVKEREEVLRSLIDQIASLTRDEEWRE